MKKIILPLLMSLLLIPAAFAQQEKVFSGYNFTCAASSPVCLDISGAVGSFVYKVNQALSKDFAILDDKGVLAFPIKHNGTYMVDVFSALQKMGMPEALDRGENFFYSPELYVGEYAIEFLGVLTTDVLKEFKNDKSAAALGVLTNFNGLKSPKYYVTIYGDNSVEISKL